MKNKLIWHPDAWEDYLYWQDQDKKTVKRINMLIKDTVRNGNIGIGKPEALTGDLIGLWSRRIDEKTALSTGLPILVLKLPSAEPIMVRNSGVRR